MLLPHISLIGQLGAEQYRMVYSTVELGIYRVRMVCDIQVMLDEANGILRIAPLQDAPPVKSEITFNSLTAPGYYHSESVFHTTDEDEQATRIDYQLQLDANLPIPYGARFMPAGVLNSIARNITNWRIHEIAQGFIARSIEDYRRQEQQAAAA